MIVATAGHIDHGKTTLVRALTGIDTDRLPEEKARGISIDLGFAHWDIPGGGSIDFVDVPGHERFIRNMLCGVFAIDHVLLVVAADDGIMPQTREHLSIIDLLGVDQGTVAITKVDRVSPERVAEVMGEVGRLLSGTGLEGALMIPLSAARGDGMELLQRRLIEAAAAVQRDRGQDALLARYIVDRVFSVPGSGTVVTGTVIAGEIAPNDRMTVSPSGTQVRVRKLQRHGKASTRAHAGERCAINLANIEHTALGRGDWLVAPDAHAPTECIEARVQVLPTPSGPLKHWTPVHVHIGSADVPAHLAMRRGASLAPGESALAQLRLDRPVCAARGDRLIIRDQSAMRTLGGGIVVDPFASVRRTAAERALTLAALARSEPADCLAELVAGNRHGVDLGWFARVFNRRRDRIEELLPPDATVLGVAHRVAFSWQWLDALQARALEWLARFHREHSSEPGVNAYVLQQKLAVGVDAAIFALLLKRFALGGRIVLQGSLVRLRGHDSTDNPRDVLTWQQVRPLLEDAGVMIPSVRELAARANLPLQVLRDFLHRKSVTGELIRVTLERFALRQTLTALAAQARDTARSFPGGLFTAAQYRDRIGTGRTLAIEILECLDKMAITHREDNGRHYVGGDPPVLPGPGIDQGSKT
ncbi:MAG: selenocysteine-specific translation elongation factor [Burkholderiales bacterium]